MADSHDVSDGRLGNRTPEEGRASARPTPGGSESQPAGGHSIAPAADRLESALKFADQVAQIRRLIDQVSRLIEQFEADARQDIIDAKDAANGLRS
jgi:hypothetical protein